MNKFKERLKELREEKSMGQAEIAEALNLPRATYANWEQGRREPDIDGIIMLAQFFAVTVGQLLGVEPL